MMKESLFYHPLTIIALHVYVLLGAQHKGCHKTRHLLWPDRGCSLPHRLSITDGDEITLFSLASIMRQAEGKSCQSILSYFYGNYIILWYIHCL
jgi:hypothetical protein